MSLPSLADPDAHSHALEVQALMTWLGAKGTRWELHLCHTPEARPGLQAVAAAADDELDAAEFAIALHILRSLMTPTPLQPGELHSGSAVDTASGARLAASARRCVRGHIHVQLMTEEQLEAIHQRAESDPGMRVIQRRYNA